MPGQPLRWGANVLFRHPPPIPAAERAALDDAGGPHPQPLSRAAGEGGVGWWTRYCRQKLAQSRYCYARLPPSSLRGVGEQKGARGKVRAGPSSPKWKSKGNVTDGPQQNGIASEQSCL